MRLYSFPLSGHSHRARLFLSLIGVQAEIIDLDLKARDHKSAAFLALNPLGQVPVLVDGDLVVADSNAILVYLARSRGLADWLPEDPAGAAAVQRWLSIAAGPLAAGPAAARLINLFGASLPVEETLAKAHAILKVIDQALLGRAFLVAEHPTLADVAIYTYVALAPEGGVSLAAYADIRAWLDRMEALPGFVAPQRSAVGLYAP
jgi:glutathione S-transferase